MPQSPIGAVVAKNASNALVPLLVDSDGDLRVAAGGVNSALDITAAKVIKATPGRLIRVVVNVVGTAGSLTLNDTTTTGGAAAANQILTIAFGSLTVGQVLTLEWPCSSGIVVSAVPTGGQVAVSFS